MAKYLFLNGVEEKALKTEGVCYPKRNGITYMVANTEEGVSIAPMTTDILVVAPLDFPKGTLILTHDQNKELRETGKTTHSKGGVNYEIVMIGGTPKAFVQCEYTNVILKSEC